MEIATQMNGIKPVSRYLFMGLLLFFVFEYVRPGSFLPILETAKFNTIIPLSVFLFAWFSTSGRTNSEILTTNNAKWIYLFLCLLFIQFFTADVRTYVFEAFRAAIGWFLMYFIIMKTVSTVGKIKGVFATLVIVHIVLVVLNPNLILHPEQRNYIEGVTFLGDGNDFAWSTCIAVPLGIFLVQTSDRKWLKIIWIIAVCLLIFTIVGTQSRGASIALGSTILYLFLKAKRKMAGLISLAVVVMAIIVFAPQEYFDRMATISEYETDGSAQGRIEAWKSAYRMGVDHPFVGVGAGHFGVKYGLEYRPPGVSPTDIPWSTAHSMYFLALGESGFIGLVFLLGFMIINLSRNEKRITEVSRLGLCSAEINRPLAIAIQASFIGFAVGGAFLSGSKYPHLYVLAGLIENVHWLTSQAIHQSQRNIDTEIS